MYEVVRDLVNAGRTIKEIVAETKLRKIEVMRVCAETKLLTRLRKNNESPRMRRSWPAQAVPKILPWACTLEEMVKAGKRAKQIAFECNISHQAVYQRMRKAGLKFPPKPKKVRMSKKYNMPIENVKLLQKLGATRAFTYQKNNARSRDIGWELTLEQWWDIWEASGKWELRGRQKGGYVMGRHGDVGPYAVGNVVICSHRENVLEREKHSPSFRRLQNTQEIGIDAR